MNGRATVILCVIAILGVVGAVLTHRGGLLADGVGQNRALLAGKELPAHAVTTIRVERAGEPALVFARAGAGWTQVEPFAWPMDPYSIEQFLVLARESMVRAVIDPDLRPELEPETMGLDPARATLRFEWPGGSLGLRLGRTGMGGLAYVQREGEAVVYVVGQELNARAIDMDPREWRDRTIFRQVGIDSDRIEIASAAGRTVLVRDRRQWRMTEPVATRLNVAALEDLLQGLGRARSAGFILDEPEDLSPFGLASPAATLMVVTTRLRPGDGAPVRETDSQRLLVGARVGMATQDRFGMMEGSPSVVRLTEPVLKALFPGPDQLAAATASGVEPADVGSIRIDGTLGVIGLQRDEERWIAPEHGGREVAADRVQQLLDVLTTVHASEIVLRPYPRDLEVATVSFFAHDGRPLDTVRIIRLPAEGDAERPWGLENGDDVIRVLPASVALELSPDAYGLPAGSIAP